MRPRGLARSASGLALARGPRVIRLRVRACAHPAGAACGPGFLLLELSVVRFILNIIWLVLAGFWLAIGYTIAAVICFILIITIPFGVAALRIALYALWPFGRTVVRKPSAGAGSVIGNIIWVILCGWWLALAHLVSGVLLCITIIGIPLGLANFKMIPISLAPFGAEIVPVQ